MPTLQEFLAAAKPQNPGVSDAELTNYYSRTYAEQPAATASPTLQEFLTAAKPKNPGVADSELTDYYNRTYAKPSTEPTQYGGFLGSAGTALKERVATALPTAKLFTGLGDQKAATDELAKHKADAGNAYKQVEFGEIGDAFKQGNYGDALGKTVEKFKEVAGSSLGSMAPAIGAGTVASLAATTVVGGAAVAAVGIPAAAVGTVAFGLTALGSYISDGISRQKEEQAKAGKPYEDVNRVSATVAAAGQTALDIFGFKFFKPLGNLVGINGKEAAEGITKEIIQAATQPRAYAKAVAAGTAKGIAFEVPQEVAQQVLERWQAGLALNPFDDPNAAKEYLDAAGGALMLGGPFGAYSQVSKTRAARAEGARQTVAAEQAAIEAQRGNKLTRDLERNPDATGPVSQPDGAGVPVVGKPDETGTAAGATTAQRSGVAVAGTDVAGTADGEKLQPGALDQQGTTNVDETAEAKQTTAQGQQTSATPRTDEEINADIADAKEAYDDGLAQVKNLLAMPSLTNPQKDMLGRLTQELGQIDPTSLNAEEVDGVPLKEAVGKLRSQPRAMQGEMFGTSKAVSKFLDMALAMAGQDPAVAIQKLQESKQRLQNQLDSDGFDNVWAMQTGRSLGLNAKEAIAQKQDLATDYVKRSSASIDQAVDELSQRVKENPWEGVTRKTKGDVETVSTALFDGVDQRNKADTSTPEYAALKTSIAKTGIVDPITVTTNSLGKPEVFEGNHRLQAARELGITEVPVVLHSRINQSESRPVAGVKPSSVLDKSGTQPRAMKIQNELFKGMKDKYSTAVKGITLAENLNILQDNARHLGNLLKSTQDKLANLLDLQKRPGVVRRPEPLEVQDAKDQIANLEKRFAINETERAKVQTRIDAGETNVSEGWQAGRPPLPEKTKGKQKTPNTNTTAVQESLFGGTPKVETKVETPVKKATPKTSIDDALKDLFVESKTTPAEEVAEPATQKETVKAPEVDTYHVRTTKAGSLIKQFFDAILPNSTNPDEQTKHRAVREIARDSFLDYDVTEPGQKSSPGINAAFQYLADLVGGQQRFNDLLSKLEGADPTTQRALLLNRGLPDLTSRKILDKFATYVGKDLQELPVIKALPPGTERTGVSIPTQNRAAPATGEAKGTIPFESKVVVHTKKAVEHGATPEGNPRRPNINEGEKEYIVQDTKLRSAWRRIKQLIANKQTPSVEALAAKNYMDNPGRETFGDVLNDLAYDLVYEEPANYTFYGEGGKYATAFQKWINENLDKSTIDTLNSLIEDQKQNQIEEGKYNAAVTVYNNKISAIKTKNAEARIQKAEKIAKVKLPRPPRISNRIAESEDTEETPSVQTSKKGLPQVQMLAEVHPAILRMIKAGDLNGTLKLLAEAKGNPYYAALATRLLEADITAKTSIVKQDEMISLSNDPNVKKSLTSQLNTAVDMVNESMPDANKKALTAALKSDNLSDIKAALAEIESQLTNDSRKQVITNIRAFVNEEYDWLGKYDPESDTIMYRQGRISNHLFLHEVIHAAALHLLDNSDSLTGVRKDAYKQLADLYDHSKGILSLEGINDGNTYGLTNLHEFVSEAMTNPEFQYLLRGIRYKAAPFSLWNAFTNSIAKLFGVKPGYESNVMVEAMSATNIFMRGTASLEAAAIQPSNKATEAMDKTIAKEAKTPRAFPAVPPGVQINNNTVRHLLTASSWDETQGVLNSLSADIRPKFIGALTLRQINDLVKNRIPQINTFVQRTEQFLAHKNGILQESGDISKTWLRMQTKDPEMSRKLAVVMHEATIAEFDPARFDPSKGKLNSEDKALLDQWKALTPEAKKIYVQVRDFYVNRYAEYQQIMMRRITDMQKLGVSETTINKIREEFEKSKGKGPYFALMRHGRFWYEVKVGKDREYYMLETAGQKETHIKERLSRGDGAVVSNEGSEYKTAMDLHARQSTFLKDTFQAIDDANFDDTGGAFTKKILKDTIYQNFLSNQPEHSFRRQFMHRKNVKGYSEDALRNFAKSSFHMAYQLSRFKFSPDLFSTIEAARIQLKGRFDPNKPGFDVKLSREKNELSDYVTEVNKRLELLLNPIDMGRLPTLFSNVGFIWYLTAPASAITNVIGGMMIGLPTIVGQNVRLNPGKSYITATLETLGQMKSVAAQILSTGFNTKDGISGFFPSLNRSTTLSDIEQDAYNRFVSDGVIDITATYDQSGLGAEPTEIYGGKTQKTMEILTALFHNAERFNREIVAMSAFRTAMEKRKDYTNKEVAFNESITEAKDVTERSMFDYSVANKPRYLQESATLKVILQFKQFPQQMTYFLVHNFYNMIKGADEATRREATARFVGTMGMAGIFSGVTGLWGFSTVANITNAVVNGLFKEEGDEEPFDFQLAFMNWAIDTFGANTGTALTRGIGNAAGIDIANNVKLDDMWRLDSRRNNQDQVQALQAFLVNLLGPTAGLLVNAAEATKLYNEGHADLAMEKILPAFLRGPAITYRYAQEGVLTKGGDVLMNELGPFDLMMQSLNVRPAKLAEIQYYNITVKGQEQAVQKERQNLLNLYALAFMSNDADTLDTVYDKIDEFNNNHPSMDIPPKSLNSTIKDHLKKSSETEHGLYIDKKLRGVIDNRDYTTKL